MLEDIGTIVNKGFSTWVRNLKICIPFFLESIIEGVISAGFFGIMAVLLLSSELESGVDIEALSPEELIAMFGSALMDHIGIAVVGFLVFYILIILIQAFFRAGAIGMAKEAGENGDTVFSDMIGYGSRNIFRLFLVTVLISLLTLAGLVFVVPGALSIGDLNLFLENPESSLKAAGLLSLGLMIWVAYALLVNLILSLVPYALVIDELDPVEAVSTGLRVFMENKVAVFGIWVLSIGLGLISGFLQQFGADSFLISFLASIFSLVVVLPLTTIWWTRLYLNRAGKKLYDHLELLNDPDEFLNSY